MAMGKRARREAIEFYAFISPWLFGFIFFTLGPILYSLYLSFTKWEILTPPQFVGIANYLKAFTDDPRFWVTLKNTVYYTFVAIPFGMVFSIVLAMLMSRMVRGISIFRMLIYLPAVSSGVAATILWIMLISNKGLINQALGLIGIHGPSWLYDVRWTMPSLIMMNLWSGVGGGMVIYLAGLQGIPGHLLEAATIDGARWFQKTRYITLPLLTPVIFLNLIMSIIGSFQIFTQSFFLQGAMPPPIRDSVLTYSLYIYQNAFEFFKMGYASALSWILFLIVFILTITQFKVSNRWVYYD